MKMCLMMKFGLGAWCWATIWLKCCLSCLIRAKYRLCWHYLVGFWLNATLICPIMSLGCADHRPKGLDRARLMMPSAPLSRVRWPSVTFPADPADDRRSSHAGGNRRKVCHQRQLHLKLPVFLNNSAKANLSGGPLGWLNYRKCAYIEPCKILDFLENAIGSWFWGIKDDYRINLYVTCRLDLDLIFW